ncbi:ATP-grasp domain-containing protein [Sporosarcina sp.]|uniref:ATP-grasp domain-containing protein n=1 Tax=Sporosarcina sp. TaxID=49982 RepID=UPI0026241871|nr:ATP-grasp domain-containing protein [Sporosarcina sp.]
MSILIMNRSSHSKVPYEKWLENIDDDIVLLTSSETKKGFGDSSYHLIEPFDNYEINSYVEIKALELNKIYNFTTIVAISEIDIIRSSELREKFKIQGQGVNSSEVFRNKIKMKDFAQMNGIAVPEYMKVNNSFDILNFINKNGYPVILKPIDGSGSIGITVINNYTDLKEYLINGIPTNTMIECFINGDMYHIDGLLINGQFIINWPSKYINGCIAFKEEKYLGSYMLEESNPLTKRLKNFVGHVINKFPTPDNTAFHAEVFHTENDELLLCEIASRVGGGKINETLHEAFGLNIIEKWVQSQCSTGKQYDQELVPKKLVGFVLIPPKQATYIDAPDKVPFEFVLESQINKNFNHSYTGPKMSSDKIAAFVVTGKSEVELKYNIQLVADWFDELSIWKSNVNSI